MSASIARAYMLYHKEGGCVLTIAPSYEVEEKVREYARSLAPTLFQGRLTALHLDHELLRPEDVEPTLAQIATGDPGRLCFDVTSGALGGSTQHSYARRAAAAGVVGVSFSDYEAAVARTHDEGVALLASGAFKAARRVSLPHLSIGRLPDCRLELGATHLAVLILGDIETRATTLSLARVLGGLPLLSMLAVGVCEDAGPLFTAARALIHFEATRIDAISAPSQSLVRLAILGVGRAAVRRSAISDAPLLDFPNLRMVDYTGTPPKSYRKGPGAAMSLRSALALLKKPGMQFLAAPMYARAKPSYTALEEGRIKAAAYSAGHSYASRYGKYMYIHLTRGPTPPLPHLPRSIQSPLVAFLVYHRALVLAGRARVSGGAARGGSGPLAWLLQTAPLWCFQAVCGLLYSDILRAWCFPY
jgi:hypothetical protein